MGMVKFVTISTKFKFRQNFKSSGAWMVLSMLTRPMVVSGTHIGRIVGRDEPKIFEYPLLSHQRLSQCDSVIVFLFIFIQISQFCQMELQIGLGGAWVAGPVHSVHSFH